MVRIAVVARRRQAATASIYIYIYLVLRSHVRSAALLLGCNKWELYSTLCLCKLGWLWHVDVIVQ